jgi:LuxR family glucitol operon transcriptional activator
MAKVTEVRLTLAAIIYSIELDLKAQIDKYIISVNTSMDFVQDSVVQEKIKQRFLKDYPSLTPNENISDVISYLDFQEFYKLLIKNKNLLPVAYSIELKKFIPELDKIVAIRNRVMHTRPLMAGDFSQVYSLAESILSIESEYWLTLLGTKNKIEQDPSYVLTLSMPTYKNNENEISHNLPIPDFDNTGFIGRQKDLQDIKKLILGNNPVISIIGDGGIGKTALALKVAYDILDIKEKNPFDIIIWSSAKTTMLTAQGIDDIKTSLQDFGGFIDFIHESIGEEKNQDDLSIILEYMEVFNVLLVIDNLETILDERIREFIREASQRCKILITSRIGLGELEFRRNLSGLTERESITLIRQLASIKQSDIVTKIPNEKLISVAQNLQFNPLALKWFVDSVELGISPEEVMQNKNSLLDFCLSNVYEKLSTNSILVINTLLASRKNLNDAQLVFLTELPSIRLRQTINELFSTTFITRDIIHENGSQEIRYTIPPFSREYLIKNHPVKKDLVKSISMKLRSLEISASAIQRTTSYNEFNLYALTIRNSNEKVVARLINEALKLSKNTEYENAIKKIDEAKSILPNYFEVYRVSAFIKASNGEVIGAEEDYKTGLSIEPDNPRLLYFYAGFLLYSLDDIENAIEFSEKVHKLRPQSEYPTFLYARCLSTKGENKKAISLIEILLNTGTLTKQTERVAYTDLISFYSYYGTEIIRSNGDYTESKKAFIKGLEIFEQCYSKKNYDERMIKNFCNVLKSFIKMIPKMHNEENIPYIKELFAKFDDLISLNQSKDYLQNLFQSTYNYTIDISKKINGQITNIHREKAFLFIKSEDNTEYYGNKKAFLYEDDFSISKINEKVKFKVGTNTQGDCATEIELCSVPNNGYN